MTIFTNDKGQEFEEVPEWSDPDEKRIVIRPVPLKPKRTVELRNINTATGSMDIVVELELTTLDQAQLIKEAVEALMEDIMGVTDLGGIERAATKARQAMRNK